MKEIIIGKKKCLITPAGEDLASRVDVEQFISNPQELRQYRSMGDGGQGQVYDLSNLTDSLVVGKLFFERKIPGRGRGLKQFERIMEIKDEDYCFTSPQPYIASDDVLIREAYKGWQQCPRVFHKLRLPKEIVDPIVRHPFMNNEQRARYSSNFIQAYIEQFNKFYRLKSGTLYDSTTPNWFVIDIEDSLKQNLNAERTLKEMLKKKIIFSNIDP